MSARSDLARIHLARKALGLDEETYRALLQRVTGKPTSAVMTADERKAVLMEFRRLGWSPGRSGRGPGGWRRRSDKAYVRKIFALWSDLKRRGLWREASRASLIAFVKEMTGVDDPEFLTPVQAGKVIEALKAIGQRGAA